MHYARRILPWLFATAMVFSGTVGRGVVLCIASNGETRLEASNAEGRCLEAESSADEHGHAECPQLFGADGHHGGCDDLTMARESVQVTPLSAESMLALPPVLYDVAITLSEASVESLAQLQKPGAVRLPSLSSDVDAIRKSVTLLI